MSYKAVHGQDRALMTEGQEASGAATCQAQQHSTQAIRSDAGHMYATEVEREIRARAQPLQDTRPRKNPRRLIH